MKSALVFFAVFVLSCQKGTLSGSVGELFPLNVARVELLRNDQAFQVSYYADNGANVDIVARLTLALEGTNFSPGHDLPLQGADGSGHRKTSVIHLAAGEPELIFPEVRQGDLHLSRGGSPGQMTQGDFSLSFVSSADVGGGRTLSGSFVGVAQDAGYGPGLN